MFNNGNPRPQLQQQQYPQPNRGLGDSHNYYGNTTTNTFYFVNSGRYDISYQIGFQNWPRSSVTVSTNTSWNPNSASQSQATGNRRVIDFNDISPPSGSLYNSTYKNSGENAKGDGDNIFQAQRRSPVQTQRSPTSSLAVANHSPAGQRQLDFSKSPLTPASTHYSTPNSNSEFTEEEDIELSPWFPTWPYK